MENSQLRMNRIRKKRSMRVRKRVRARLDKPRLCVVKTNKQLYVQLIDDREAHVLASASTVAKEFRNTEHNRKNKAAATQLGLKIAQLAKEKNVEKVVFDRGRFRYHGVIAAVADGAREGGLHF